MKSETISNLTNKFDRGGKKYLFAVMKNVVQLSRSIGNSVFNLFFNCFFDDDFLGFWTVNNFEPLHRYSSSIK